jgi:hypothetical protein
MTTTTALLAGTISLTLAPMNTAPDWPAGLPEPVVTFAFAQDALETSVAVDGDAVEFWRGEGLTTISNSIYDQDHSDSLPSERPWAQMGVTERESALHWGAAVHRRVEYALAVVGEAVAVATPAADLIIGYATGKQPEPTSAKDAGVARVAAALRLWPDTEDGSQSRIQDMLTDLRHHCKAEGLDLEAALRDSLDAFESEAADPNFAARR